MRSERKARRFFFGKRIIITGSSRGIGRKTAELLGSFGARLVINGRNQSRLDEAVSAIGSNGTEVSGIACDLSDPAKSKELIERGAESLGGIDILINNAGMSMRGNFADLDPEVFRSVFCSNLFGAISPSIYSLPYLRESAGSLVFISSVAGIRGLPGLSAYCSSKMALRAVAESLRFELKGTGVHTGLVYVGYTINDAGKSYMAADGSMKPMEERGSKKAWSQERVATGIARSIMHRKFITVMTGLGKLNYYIQRISPSFVEYIIGNAQKRVASMSR